MNTKVSVATVLVGLTVLAACASNAAPERAKVEDRRQRIVSTSGVPHADVADYRASPFWRSGMPRGANLAWRTYLATTVRQVSAGANTILHQGDMIEGRWGADVDGVGVFGPVKTYKQQYHAVETAGGTIYPWIKAFWSGHDTLWGMGDHEIGDIGGTGVVGPGTFRYRAHSAWMLAWRRTFGAPRHADRRGRVGIITLNPIVRWPSGIRARIPTETSIGCAKPFTTGERTG